MSSVRGISAGLVLYMVAAFAVGVLAFTGLRSWGRAKSHGALFGRAVLVVEERRPASAHEALALIRETLSRDEIEALARQRPGFIPAAGAQPPTLIKLPRGVSVGAVVPLF